MVEISVVVPVFGCPNAIPELCRRIVTTMEERGLSFEIILVDDRDGMGSWERIKAVAAADERIKGISFTHNCGQDKAVTAGVKQAVGQWIVAMDCDLQDAPENIPILYDMAVHGGNDVVFVRRQKRKDPLITRGLSRLFHRVFSYLSELPFDYELGTYLIASRRAVDQYCAARDRGRDFTMYLIWLDYKHDFIEFEHEKRYDGESSYTLGRRISYAVKMMTTFSTRVLFIPIHLGVISVIGSLIYLVYILVMYLSGIANPEGWNTLAAAVFFFGGAILSTLGIIGLYLGNVFDMTKNRPLYVIQETINCDQ